MKAGFIGVVVVIIVCIALFAQSRDAITAENLRRLNGAMGTAFRSMDEAEAEWRRRQIAKTQPAERIPHRFSVVLREPIDGSAAEAFIVRDSVMGECRAVISNGSEMSGTWLVACPR